MIDWQAILKRYSNRSLFIAGDERVTYGEFHGQLSHYKKTAGGKPLTMPDLSWKADSFASLLGNLESGRSVLLGSESQPIDLTAFAGEGPYLILKSGGTTAEPRHFVHDFVTFLVPYDVKDRSESRTMILYAADHLAGLDAFLQALHRGSSLIIPDDRSATGVAQAIEQNQVEVLAATPSMLQFLLIGGLDRSRNLSSVRTIVHGAEKMPGHLRQRLFVEFAQPRFLNRYGLTELGSLPVNTDAEDPDAFILDAEGYEWQITEGELFIKSPAKSMGTLEGGPFAEASHWHATGDLAESTSAGAVRILGRRESVINVGGTKVFAAQIEELLLADDAVLDATVFPAQHAITGDSVTAKVVFRGEPDVAGLLRRVRKQTIENGLPLACAPTRILPVDQLKITNSFKKQRFPDCHDSIQP